jgi:hypothetical protein
MGVILKSLPLLAPSKVVKQITEEIKVSFIECGFTAEDCFLVVEKVVQMAVQEMDGKYMVTNMAAHEQLYGKARKLLFSLDEQGKLEDLLPSNDNDLADDSEPQAAEPQIEDAINAVESIDFTGSEKQIAWAKSIALDHVEQIAESWQGKNFTLPTQAKWWIDHRTDICKGLCSLCSL